MEDSERGFSLALSLPNCCLPLIITLGFSPCSEWVKGSPNARNSEELRKEWDHNYSSNPEPSQGNGLINHMLGGTRWWRIRWMWSASLCMDTSERHLQTQKCTQNTSWEWTGEPDQQKRIYRTTQNLRSSLVLLRWEHYLHCPRLPEN